jgi:transposase InsO family protein
LDTTQVSKEVSVIDRNVPPRRMRFSYESRCRSVQLIRAGMSASAAAMAAGASRASVYRWWSRFHAEGWVGLLDRPSTPHHQPRRLPQELEARIAAARQDSGDGPQALGAKLGLPASTVGKVLRRCGLSRTPRPPRPPVVRYERGRPGELLHLDIKKLGRFWELGRRVRDDGRLRSRHAGWQYVHVAVDDHSRLAYAEVLPSERQGDAVAFLQRALTWYRGQGIVVEALLTDNGAAYRSGRFRRARLEAGLTHRFTRPYTPRTNGKAERFIQTLLRQWAYRYAYPTSAHRTRALAGWLRWYNRRRPHGSLGGLPPISRVSQVRGHYT